MALDRREFLTRSGIAMGAAALAPLAACDTRDRTVAAAAETTTDLSSWNRVRAQFELDRDYLHFAAPVLAAHPKVVRDAIEHHRRELDRNTKLYLYGNEVAFEEEVQAKAIEYFGPASGGIAMTDSTTMGLGLLYAGIQVRPDQEVVTSDHDFYATHETLRLRRERSGLSFRKIELYRDIRSVTADEIVGRIQREIRPNTRVLALTWVHSSTGLKLPARAISNMLEGVNRNRDDDDRVLFCLDSVHAIGAEQETPGDIGCDFLVTGCHKWLFGPRGTGVIWARSSAWPAAHPTIPTFDGRSYLAWLEGIDPVAQPGAAMTPGGFHSFEHRWALAEALQVHLDIGKRRITKRTHALARRLKEGLAEIPGVDLVTPMNEDLSAGIVCFIFDPFAPEQIVDLLERDFRILATVTPYRDTYIRFMPSIVNPTDEIDEALLALRALAA